MRIERHTDAERMTMKIMGRLDTTTAPELEAAIQGGVEGILDLTLDFDGLEYISSAGLRVILKAQKLMSAAKGSMKLQNVNETIMEIFEITGFADILTIE